MKKNFALILILFCAVPVVAQSEERRGAGYMEEPIEQHPFAEPAWVEVTRDLDYSPYGKLQEKERREDRSGGKGKGDLEAQRQEPAIKVEWPLAATIIKFLIVLSAVVALALLLKHFLGFGGIPRNKKIDAGPLEEVQLQHIEENLHEAKLDDYIRQAVAQGQYALAIRLYFLAILKELSLRQAIRWKKNKTNREYLQELQNSADQADFLRTAHIFERVWYGNRTIDASAFRDAEGPFADFLRRLKEKAQ